MIPKEIKYADVSKAINHISQHGYPQRRKSTVYDLEFKGELFPPKYVISVAAEFSEYKRFFYHNEFITTEAKSRLEKLGFKVKRKDEFSHVEVLDDLIPKKSRPTREGLKLALERLAKLSPERVIKIVEVSDRKDTQLVRLLKSLYDFKCQMPGCDALILKKNGERYCEIAHISPFHVTQSSKVENLIVLCPNHHKEFDLGNRTIKSWKNNIVAGTLNGREFEFRLKI